ncbi:hypothetical protein H6G00_19910 [Leptolyngbya sp. FACHB-541]|uniref:hypothetical protein n=1 Tax=Leptolyngbya sp. FACHB-541 TaxID=2692810 RepID=UPI001684781F|nr:hypothetical protein [Leptolyngbya sp. FACHB-541]MBD1998858.1 hypothetical protein [Leptolyngbya sp. FACHB-541]
MSHSIRKQAIPVESFEQICNDQPLLILIDDLWGHGGGMFHWFAPTPITSFGYIPNPIEELKREYQEYGTTENFLNGIFKSEDELESYCILLERFLEQLKASDPSLVHRNIFFDGRIGEQIYKSLKQELKIKFPNLDAEFARRVVWEGEQIKPGLELLYLNSDQVKAIAQVLHQVEVNELLQHSDTLQDHPVFLEEFCRTIQEFKTCFKEAADRGQLILTKVI